MNRAEKLVGWTIHWRADAGFVEFNRSFGFDRRLFEADVRASIAHCNGLLRGRRFEPPKRRRGSRRRCNSILEHWAADPGKYFEKWPQEDIHTFVEAHLVELIGATGRRKLHTGRSRNDQVATDLRLWLREQIDQLTKSGRRHRKHCSIWQRRIGTRSFPGYTHLQRAQPVLFAHWCLAYFEMLARDRERLADARKRVNVMPLGSAALAGTSYPIDREAVARELGFESVSRNSLDAVSDRDFCVEFVGACSLVMVHLSRLAEDIIIYSTTEFGFLRIERCGGDRLEPDAAKEESRFDGAGARQGRARVWAPDGAC